ncbi:MAG TPA: hypothetical protein VHL57_12220 [Flavobacteriales bacterium]|nr:hypothetical protein [Flavobacteriales bacterium]
MRTILTTGCLAAALCTLAQSKPLLQNGGFEILDKEPTTYDQLKYATEWTNVTIGYSELFTKGAPAKTIGIPDNDYGHMDPKEGEYYAGFCAWKDDVRADPNGDPDDPFQPGWNVYSEYLMAPLNIPMVEGHTYHVVIHFALSGNSDRAVAGLGAYFSPMPLHYEHRKFLQERPQVVGDSLLAEKGKWVTVEGEFVADGGERYIVLGCFPTATFDTKKLIEGPDNRYAYYYVDAVKVEEVQVPTR